MEYDYCCMSAGDMPSTQSLRCNSGTCWFPSILSSSRLGMKNFKLLEHVTIVRVQLREDCARRCRSRPWNVGWRHRFSHLFESVTLSRVMRRAKLQTRRGFTASTDITQKKFFEFHKLRILFLNEISSSCQPSSVHDHE